MEKIILTGSNGQVGSAIYLALKDFYQFALFTRSTPKYYIDSKDIIYTGDLANEDDIEDFIDQVIIRWDAADILINCAGIINLKSIEQYTKQDYLNIFNVNVLGTFLLTQKVLAIMKEQKNGYIINIGSTRSITSAPNKSLYSMSKFALRSFTQSINLEYKEFGIQSTILCPGQIGENKIPVRDIVTTIQYLLTLDKKSLVPEIIIGGQL